MTRTTVPVPWIRVPIPGTQFQVLNLQMLGLSAAPAGAPGSIAAPWLIHNGSPHRRERDEEGRFANDPDRGATGAPALSPILVVDDDEGICDLLKLVLEDEGFPVTLAHNGVEAMRCLERAPQPFGAVILDLRMPVMDGRQFYREMRLTQQDSTPVLILSAFGARRAQRELGADAALAKPFDLDELVVAIKRLVQG